MQPSPILFMTSDAAERQATFEARDLERRRVIVEAERDAVAARRRRRPDASGRAATASRSFGHLLAGRRRGATGTGL